MDGNDPFLSLLLCFNALHPFEFLIRCSFSNYSLLPTYCAAFTPCRSTRRSPASHFLSPPCLSSLSPSFSLSLSSEMKQELTEEGSRCSILSKQHRFNEHCCIRCCAPFTFLFNPKRQCLDCQYNVCKTCCTYIKRDRAWLCSACQKGRLVFAHTRTLAHACSGDWRNEAR